MFEVAYKDALYRQVYMVKTTLNTPAIASSHANKMPMLIGELAAMNLSSLDVTGQVRTVFSCPNELSLFIPFFVGMGNTRLQDIFIQPTVVRMLRMLSDDTGCAYVDQMHTLCTYRGFAQGNTIWDRVSPGMMLVLEDVNYDLVPPMECTGNDELALIAAGNRPQPNDDMGIDTYTNRHRTYVDGHPTLVDRLAIRSFSSYKREDIADPLGQPATDSDAYLDIDNGFDRARMALPYDDGAGTQGVAGNTRAYTLDEVKIWFPKIRGFSIDPGASPHCVRDVAKASRLPRITTNM